MKALYFLPAMCGVAVILSACSEIDQQAKTQKVYADKKDEKPYDANAYGNEFGGDKAKWEKKLQERSLAQNEYLRTETAK